MRYPNIKVPARKRVLIDRFRGYEHLPTVSAGAFYDMENLSGDRAPLLRTRPGRQELRSWAGWPNVGLLAMGGRGEPVQLDRNGTLWCGGVPLPRLLKGRSSLCAEGPEGSVGITDEAALQHTLRVPGLYQYRYRRSLRRWVSIGTTDDLPEALFDYVPELDGTELTVSYSHYPENSGLRQLVLLGGWVCVFPDGRFANTVKLRQGLPMTEAEDYGDMAQSNECQQGGTLFSPCDAEGRALEPVWSDTAPAGGYWVDSSEPTPRLRLWSQSLGLWQETAAYVKCAVPGIAKGLRAGDSVELLCRLESNQGPEALLERLWDGTHTLAGAWHDPGGADREEGRGDYLILPGLLPETLELELSSHDRSFFSVTRPIPEMDFVVEAGNRLWGCRCRDGINELYGSKLGDFRNWNAFEGLSTDSYRVARGHDGPYTGAAVLGGCPLFFRADCLEKIYPSAAGDHGVVTVSLSGIEPGSAASAVVIGNRLYYKSPEGICCYNGTLPVPVSRALGEIPYRNAVAGASGSRYYVCMEDPAGKTNLFVLDTETGFWYREDDFSFRAAYSWGRRLCLLPRAGALPVLAGEDGSSGGIRWWAETGELSPPLGTRRYISRVQLSARLEPGAAMRLSASYDGGPWIRLGSLEGSSLQTVTLPAPLRRCARVRLRLEGRGGMELHSLSWLTEAGSDL